VPGPTGSATARGWGAASGWSGAWAGETGSASARPGTPPERQAAGMPPGRRPTARRGQGARRAVGEGAGDEQVHQRARRRRQRSRKSVRICCFSGGSRSRPISERQPARSRRSTSLGNCRLDSNAPAGSAAPILPVRRLLSRLRTRVGRLPRPSAALRPPPPQLRARPWPCKRGRSRSRRPAHSCAVSAS